MPNCFTLTKKNADEPEKLSVIDTELWNHFEGSEPEGNKAWYKSWYDIIGLGLATGMSFKDIKGQITNPRTFEIAVYLDEHYISNAWYSPHK
jgi:hypothetical protein